MGLLEDLAKDAPAAAAAVADPPPTATPPVTAPVAPLMPMAPMPETSPRATGITAAALAGSNVASQAFAVATGSGKLQQLASMGQSMDFESLRAAQGIAPLVASVAADNRPFDERLDGYDPASMPALKSFSELAAHNPKIEGNEVAHGAFSHADTAAFLATSPDPLTGWAAHARTLVGAGAPEASVAGAVGLLQGVAPRLLTALHWSPANAAALTGDALARAQIAAAGVELAKFSTAVDEGLLHGADDGMTKLAVADWKRLRSGAPLDPVATGRVADALVLLSDATWWSDSPELTTSPLASVERINIDDPANPKVTMRYTQFDSGPTGIDNQMDRALDLFRKPAAMVEPMQRNIVDFHRKYVTPEQIDAARIDPSVTDQQVLDDIMAKRPFPADDAFDVAGGAMLTNVRLNPDVRSALQQAWRNASLELGAVTVAEPTYNADGQMTAKGVQRHLMPEELQSLIHGARPSGGFADHSAQLLAGEVDRIAWGSLDDGMAVSADSDPASWGDEDRVRITKRATRQPLVEVSPSGTRLLRDPSSQTPEGAFNARTPALGLVDGKQVMFGNEAARVRSVDDVVADDAAHRVYPEGGDGVWRRDGHMLVVSADAQRDGREHGVTALNQLRAELSEQGIVAQLEVPRPHLGEGKVRQSGTLSFAVNADLQRAQQYVVDNAQRVLGDEQPDVRAYVDGAHSAPPGLKPAYEHYFTDDQGRAATKLGPANGDWQSHMRVVYVPEHTVLSEHVPPMQATVAVQHPSTDWRERAGDLSPFERYQLLNTDTGKWSRGVKTIALALDDVGPPKVAFNTPAIAGADPERTVIVRQHKNDTVVNFASTDGTADGVYGRKVLDALRRIGVSGPVNFEKD